MKISTLLYNDTSHLGDNLLTKELTQNHYTGGYSGKIIETEYFKSNFFDKVIRKLSLRNISMVVRKCKIKYRKFSNIIELISKHYYENFDIRVIISSFFRYYFIWRN